MRIERAQEQRSGIARAKRVVDDRAEISAKTGGAQ
jgi:hypothetical protein